MCCDLAQAHLPFRQLLEEVPDPEAREAATLQAVPWLGPLVGRSRYVHSVW